MERTIGNIPASPLRRALLRHEIDERLFEVREKLAAALKAADRLGDPVLHEHLTGLALSVEDAKDLLREGRGR